MTGQATILLICTVATTEMFAHVTNKVSSIFFYNLYNETKT